MAEVPLYVRFPSVTGHVFIDVRRIVAVSDTEAPIVREGSKPGEERVVTMACVVLDTGATAFVEGPAEDVMQTVVQTVNRQHAKDVNPWTQAPDDRPRPR